MNTDLLEGAVAEIAHPFGEVAFVEPIKRRAALPTRDMVAYGEDEAAAGSIDKEDEEEHASGEFHEPSRTSNETKPGDGGGGGDTSSGAKKRKKSGDGKRSIVKSVRLPNWMDLDQESMPNGGQPVAVVDTRRQEEGKPVEKPAKLDDFGGVGELTVQLRTSRAPESASFNDLLDSFTSIKDQEMGRRKEPPDTYICHRCKVRGHWIEDCPKKDAVGARSTPPETYVCHACGVPGHWLEHCPNRNQTNVRQSGKATKLAGQSCEEIDDQAEGDAPSTKRPKNQASKVGNGGKTPSQGQAASDTLESKRHGVPAPGYVCNACHGVGHWLEQCPRYEEYRQGAPPAGYVCIKCNQAGHWVHKCTAAPKGGWKEHSAADGRNQELESLVVGPLAREIGEEIAEALEEDLPEVVSLVQRCVQALGEATSRQLLVQTWQVEASGGLLTTDGSNRRRTPGGVFFWLVKQKASPEDRVRIFATANGNAMKS